MTTRLGEDHENARCLGEKLAQTDGIILDMPVYTNMVFFSLDESVPLDAPTLIERLERDHNVKLGAVGPRSFRAVTHYWISGEGVNTAASAIRDVLQKAV
jgi:threonine aldolase